MCYVIDDDEVGDVNINCDTFIKLTSQYSVYIVYCILRLSTLTAFD